MNETNTAAQTAETTTVIDFAHTGKSRSPRRGVKKRPSHPDADLIENCIECAMQITAGKAPYKIDPTDSEFAAFCDDICRSRADRALRAVLDMSPSTLDGLRAKAGLVEVVMEDWTDYPGGVQFDELQTTFLLSLAKDVIRFQRAAMVEKTSHLTFSGADK
ncbi:hypothetical protein ABIF21_007114 [Bradyrhizobium elkanii]|nr:hypothetical protein [Bradyrhizobium elkanii]MCW2112498.1 hypothetical protein [Bradyrhizobium elkanii]MCW2199145.1 hypothetical protein [Bradyrhizobium elkanii]MCW2229302.1 hypothetical protein [Bradyrhizobium elkanii]NWL38090.1 hypothetical protein [Bradyrhizobium elkanii]RYM15745.1 hypothetical protein EWH13_38555 [Bradyrhizobium elkanii]